jgi:ferredoxin
MEKASVLNNVETWASVPLIINKGSEWYAGNGTEWGKGTKLVSLSGNIVNTGVAEVPFGITIRDIVYDIGGGIPNGKKLKAVHFGGPMGGSIPGGMTILEAAQKADIFIPTLCHHEKLEPYGACRMCTVEVEVRGWTSLIAACLYPVEKDLVVQTRSEKVDKIRTMIGRNKKYCILNCFG